MNFFTLNHGKIKPYYGEIADDDQASAPTSGQTSSPVRLAV